MDNNKINKNDIVRYGYYNDSSEYVIVLNESALKEILGADKLVWEETELEIE